jgi:hypothetical protein
MINELEVAYKNLIESLEKKIKCCEELDLIRERQIKNYEETVALKDQLIALLKQ